VYRLCEPDELLAAAHETAAKIVKKRPRVVRAAKAALNLIDPFHLQHNYRLEQGFTYELNLYGDGDQARDEFVAGTRVVTKDSDR
jgi:enoyl-CoA hydratase